jgi:hypothetical protein
MSVKVRNFTGRPVTVFSEDGKDCVTYQPDRSHRVKAEYKMSQVGDVDGFVVKETIPTIVDGFLPEEQGDVLLLVQRVVFEAMEGREDLICPGPSRKDSKGNIVGCWGFSV